MMTVKARIDKRDKSWVLCGKCGHKLFKTMTGQMVDGIEVKCHSCKAINVTNAGKEKE